VEREIIKLLVTRMSDSNFLKKLLESVPSRLAEVTKKEEATTGY
jgi:hypothetical protein